MSCLWYNSNNKEKAFNCQFCAVEPCESRNTKFDIVESISTTSIQPPSGKDELDEWLEKECGIVSGACSSIENLKYSIGREVAEKMKNDIIEKTVEWLKSHWRDYVWTTYNGIPHFGLWENDFRKAMKGD